MESLSNNRNYFIADETDDLGVPKDFSWVYEQAPILVEPNTKVALTKLRSIGYRWFPTITSLAKRINLESFNSEVGDAWWVADAITNSKAEDIERWVIDGRGTAASAKFELPKGFVTFSISCFLYGNAALVLSPHLFSPQSSEGTTDAEIWRIHQSAIAALALNSCYRTVP